MPISSDQRARLPAWIASSAVHLTAVLLLFSMAGTPSGNEQAESFREVGIVVREPSPESVEFDAPVETTEPTPTPSELNQPNEVDLAEVFPESDAPSPFADLLAELTAEKPVAAEQVNETSGSGPTGGKLLREMLPPGEVRLSVFGVEGTGSRFVYAFDRSFSMAGPPLSSAKRQLIASLEGMKSVNQFQILFFNNRLSLFDLTGGQRRIAYATADNKQRAANYVAGVTADGGTEHYAALAKSLSYNPDAVFFLTDAGSPMSREHLEKVIARCRSTGTTINTIEFGRGPQRQQSNFLITLAKQTDGQYGYIDTTRLSY